MNQFGILYIVGTPIGNLEDISMRAVRILKEVDEVAAEDTRHSRKLLDRCGIATRLTSHHQHNQAKTSARFIERLKSGENIALITDAGTPLVSDPGATLVQRAQQHGIRVVPIPGPSALTSALSVCGLDIGKFHFEGFLPARSGARVARLDQLAKLDSGLVFFETPHRITESVKDMVAAFGDDRSACIAREMTKLHESIQTGKLGELAGKIINNPQHCKGEFVVIIEHRPPPKAELDDDVRRALKVLMEELSARKAAQVGAKIFGIGRNLLYKHALELRAADDETDADEV